MRTIQDDDFNQQGDDNSDDDDSQRDDGSASASTTPKMSVQHMEIRCVRLGSGWKLATDVHKYTLSYYNREKRLALTTKNTVMDSKKHRGGHVQFL